MRLLVTGGAGFIGSHFIRLMVIGPGRHSVVNLDKLTYAGNLENLNDIKSSPNYKFVQGDICDRSVVEALAAQADAIVNFAAETHVDRSIEDPGSFIQTDVAGTQVLLDAAKKYGHQRYLQVSTDEVYGSLESGSFTESSVLHPNSPYAASKAAADLLALSYFTTYGLPVVITRSSNNFGSHQYPEKFIPLSITQALQDKPIPLYGDGMNVRDWIEVDDNCRGIQTALEKGRPGEVYNIGGGNERKNIDIVRSILKELGKPESLIQPVKDRLGHDRRYSVDSRKIKGLGFQPTASFDAALSATVQWYVEHREWWGKTR